MRAVTSHDNLLRSTAWYGESRHPAEGVPCPTCRAPSGKPCISTIAVPGTSIGIEQPLRGLHADRIRASEGAS